MSYLKYNTRRGEKKILELSLTLVFIDHVAETVDLLASVCMSVCLFVITSLGSVCL